MMKKFVWSIAFFVFLAGCSYVNFDDLKDSDKKSGGIDTVEVKILNPTNNQIINTGYIFNASAYFKKGIQDIMFHYTLMGSDTTNSKTNLFDGQKFANASSKLEFGIIGSYTVWATASSVDDDKGISEFINVSLETSYVEDTEPPVVSITSHTNNQKVGSVYTLSGSVSDNQSIGNVYVKTDNESFTAATLTGDGLTRTWSKEISVPEIGIHTNFVYAVDEAMNVSVTQSIILEYVAGMPSVTISNPQSGTVTNTLTLTINGTANVASPAVIESVEVKVGDSGEYSTATGTVSWSKNITLSEATNKIYVRANADNGLDYISYVTVVADITAPNVVISTPANGAEISSSTILVTGTASDTLSGVRDVWVDRGNGFLKANGTTDWNYQFLNVPQGAATIRAYSRDYAGNYSSTNSVNVTVVYEDTTPPTINITTPSHTTTESVVTVSGTASDDNEVVAVYVKVGSGDFYSASGTTEWSKSVTLSEGQNIIYAYARDGAGNHSSTNQISITYSPDGVFTVYFKKPSVWPGAFIHYWPDGTEWASCPAMTDIGNAWYSYTFTDRTSTSLLFKDKSGTNNSYQTPDLQRTGDGWYWTNGVWYASNPEDENIPVVVINSPTDNRQVSTDSIIVSGEASGGGGITVVYVRVNGGDYTTADGTTSWSKNISLDMGTNNIDVYAKGLSGNDSAVESRTVIRVEPSGELPVHTGSYSGKQGAHLYQNGVEFSIWWRNAVVGEVWVTGDFNGWTKTSLTRISGGENDDIWWAFIESAGVGDEYRFIGKKSGVDVVVADPFSQYNRYSGGNSVVVDHTAYEWQTDSSDWSRPGWEYYIMYEMHVKDFTSSATDVTPAYRGKYLGTIEKLDYLTNLGITAIELMPINEFPDAGYSWGYNTALYLAVESGYAVNPSAGQGGVDEFKALVDACHAHGIAVILDVVFNHTANNDNWLWEVDNVAYFDGETPWGNRLNTWHPQVIRMGKQTIEMFMEEYRIDGFRFDASHTDYMNHDFLKELKTFASSIDPNVYFVYENLPNQDSLKFWGAQWAAEYRHRGADLLRGKGGIDMTYFAQHIYYTKDHGWSGSPVETVNYLESHDEDTLAYLFNLDGYNTGTQKAKTRLGAVMLATSLGNPMLWMGQEFLRAREGQNIDELPLDWSLLTSNGDVYDYYAGVFRLRKNHPALRHPNEDSLVWRYTPWDGDNNVIAYSRVSPDNPSDKKFVIVLNNNFYDVNVWVGFPEDGTWTKVVTEGAVDQTGTINVSGGGYTVNVGSNSGIIFMK